MPKDWCLVPFAKVKTPRVLAFRENGDLLVSSPLSNTPGQTDPGIGGVYVLYDDNQDGVADSENSILFDVRHILID